MRSMFVSAPFSRYDLGREALGNGNGGGLPRLSLGVSSGLIKDFTNLFSNKDKLKSKEKDCESKSGTDKIICYGTLASEAYKDTQDSGNTTTNLQPIAPVQPASSFPIIPVVVATLGAGALIWFLVSRGKKK